jgi:DNA helicase-2/ATP-dependent DNA helicase PcrA
MDLSTYREADLCSSSTFKERLFVSTVHKAKGLEFENVLVLRCIDGRYPHFAHNTREQKEEDKRLFYVGISRAMKRLVVSGYQKTSFNDITTITPFIKSIIHHFTLRTEISNSNGIRVVLEIGSELLMVNRIVQKTIQRKDYDISHVYDNGAIKNQFDIKRLILSHFTRADVFGSIENTLRTIGGFPKSNN